MQTARRRGSVLVLVTALATSACAGPPGDASVRDAAGMDTGSDTGMDAAVSGSRRWKCCEDAGQGERDTGVETGADPETDGGTLTETVDAAVVDAAVVDAAVVDAAVVDTGLPSRDAARSDASAGVDDAGTTGAAGTCRPWPGGTIDVLFIGNSQIEVSNLPRVVSDLAATAPAGCVRIRSERFALGGANLAALWSTQLPDGRRLPETIASGRYELVVIAESIDLAEHQPVPFPALFVEYATRIVEASRAAGAVPLLYATPYIDAPDRTGFRAMADPQIALGSALDVGVAAGGLAWLRVWEVLPEVDLHAADHLHPGCLGTYVSALVIWAAITGGSPVGLDYSMAIEDGAGVCPPISAAQASVFQRSAWAQQLATGP